MDTKAHKHSFIIPIITSVLFLASPAVAMQQPKLVLQITVDALRGDLPTRYYDRLEENGFRYLWEKGTVYVDAHYDHANTETIVGHTILATGAQPSVHGMIGNIWYDRTKGRTVYNIEDDNFTLLTPGAGVDQSAEIDSTQKAAKSDGRSPAAIMVSTLGDELAIHTAGRSKIFGVSVKDRGAVSMAGHAGKAFWFSKASGEFVTSNYYYQQYPDWVDQWNAKKLAFSYSGKSWNLLYTQEEYLFGEADDRPWETDIAGFGRIFPHPYGTADGKYFTTLLTLSPAGDQLTLDFAKALIINEQLGKDDIPDYLSVSFSSTDYVGHIFGPSSLESEDNILQLDRTLADLLTFIDEKVGLEQTLIVLSADHGTPEVPGYLKQMGLDGGFVDPKSWDKKPALASLKKQFGIGKELIVGYNHPYIYLDHQVIEEHQLNLAQVEQSVAEQLLQFEGVAQAISSSALREGNLPNTPVIQSILNNFNPNRSGDVYIVFQPHWFINDFDGLEVSSTHGSPWRYDTYVPIVFSGMQIPAQQIQRRVHPVDIAATLATYLGIKSPSGCAGKPLTEIFVNK
ncbi:alkaline phosphatase family protein [Desulfopila aestuarii]|uniref:Type I phosphodiesterase / nucleotide pyrophosphatase n=1 Tax=Desulfopila aestuarii DSM 18488 TaxID=1121416 RepID=A0A1M7YEZ9_9BACT|nr:alkaline phosphatase family protein [Desulfopila aestuarii]SHO51214.1 Type I phosphodiesterase / nucleotide pyrophosphatase [Desulfopila aestuarii DSM 18488]